MIHQAKGFKGKLFCMKEGLFGEEGLMVQQWGAE